MQTTYANFPSLRLISLNHHQTITLDPTSPWGYKIKHTALYRAGQYDSAIDTPEVMLSKIVKSSDPDIQRELYFHYHDEVLRMLRQSTVTGTLAHADLVKRAFGTLVVGYFRSTLPPR